MGLLDAKADQVRYEIRMRGTVYYPKCFFCLKEVKSISYVPQRHYVCTGCKPLIKTFRKYYNDKTSKHLFEALAKENNSV